MKLQALLPMKGHSERVPAKNLRSFAGKPLFFHVLETLLSSHFISGVLIDTDSPHIASLAEKFPRVTVISRPEHLCGDFVSMNEVIAYDMQHCPEEHFLQTHSTNPLLTRKTLDRAVEEYFCRLSEFDSLFTVTRLQSRLYSPEGPVNHDPSRLERTQDLPPLFEENSNLYIFSRQAFVKAQHRRIGLRPQMFPMSRLEATDIDEPEDFILAETLYRARQKSLEQDSENSEADIIAWATSKRFSTTGCARPIGNGVLL